MEKYRGQMKDVEYSIRKKRKHVRKKNITTIYCEDIMTLDIESTSAWFTGSEVIGYQKGKSSDYWNELIPLALPYIWQFSHNGKVYYGREFREFEQVLKDIPKEYNCVIWVHNLSWEFQFLSDFLEWKKLFARAPHKVMYATPKKYPNITFKCSYFLSQLSLDTWGKQLGFKKLSGYDYEKLRTPLTQLTKFEMDYAERDCLVLEKGIRKYLDEFKVLEDIPLTQTGIVRREVKKRLMENEVYAREIKKLVPESAELYKILMQVFSGGYTHASKKYAGRIIDSDYVEAFTSIPKYPYEPDNRIRHWDYASSYPFHMLGFKYMCNPWAYLPDMKELPTDRTFEDYTYIVRVRLENVEVTTNNTFIQKSKLIDWRNIENDNGRVVKADMIEGYFLWSDWIIIENIYKWDNIEVLEVYETELDYLPIEVIEYILELYKFKTELKGIKPENEEEAKFLEELYLNSKQRLNCIFGLMATKIIMSSVSLENGEWKVEPLTAEKVEAQLDKLRRTWKGNDKYFVEYTWGAQITSYSKLSLWSCILGKNLYTKEGQNQKTPIRNDDYIIYCDTDSAFGIGKLDFSWWDSFADSQLKKMCEYYNLDYTLTRPKDKNGVEHPLGHFTEEEPIIEFKTLGAKRYCERREDGKLHLTVSGINKSAVKRLNYDIKNRKYYKNGSLDLFEDGLNFNKDLDCVQKKLATYVNEQPVVTYPDGYISEWQKGINLRRTGYKISISTDYMDIMEKYSLDDISENAFQNLRGEF